MKPAQIFNKALVEYLSCEKCGLTSAVALTPAIVFVILVDTFISIIPVIAIFPLCFMEIIVHDKKFLALTPSVHDHFRSNMMVIRHEAQIYEVDHIVVHEYDLAVIILMLFVVTVRIPVRGTHSFDRHIINFGSQAEVESDIQPAHTLPYSAIHN